MELSDYIPQIEANGVRVVVILNEDTETLSEFELKYDIPYLILGDEQSEVIRALGLFNPDYDIGTKYYGVPYPGVFLLDANGIIVAKFAEESYRDRPVFDELVAAVVRMVSAKHE